MEAVGGCRLAGACELMNTVLNTTAATNQDEATVDASARDLAPVTHCDRVGWQLNSDAMRPGSEPGKLVPWFLANG